MPILPKIYASSNLGNLKWQIEPSTQYLLLVHFNESINSHKHGWLAVIVSKNRQTCSKLHHLHITCSKCPLQARSKISDVDELKGRIKNEWTVWITLFIERAVGDVAPASTRLRSCWRQTFRVYDVQMCDLQHVWWQLLPVVFVTLQWFIKMYCTCT